MTSSEDFLIRNGVLAVYKGYGGLVEVPEGVTKIGREAFSGCAGLERVTLPESVTEIGYQAFAGCSGLRPFSSGSRPL